MSRLLDAKVFWQFHFCTNNFLRNFAIDQNKDRTKYPWDDYNIHFGDFERIYNDVLHIAHPLFIDAFSSEANCSIFFQCLTYQFGRFVSTQEELVKFQHDVEHFRRKKLSFGERKLFCLQLGVTNHWVSFVVLRYGENIEFYYMDSSNKSWYGMSDEEIEKYIHERNEYRVSVLNKTRWNKFKLMVNTQGLKDQNKLLKLLMDIFTGKLTIFGFLWQEGVYKNYDMY